MAEEIEHVSSDRQAAWVALRTLRQRPTLVGRTDEGVPVYEIRSVRLVLAPGAAHFRRLATCARCERDVPGPPVLVPADLNRPPSLVFCDRCARSAGAASPEVPRPSEDSPAPALAAVFPPVVTEAKAGERQRLSEQVADLLRAQNAELAELSASVAGVRAELRELGASNQALRSEISSLQRRVDEEASAPSELGALAESTQALARRDAEIETRLGRELADLRASLAAMADATAQPLHVATGDGLAQLGSQIASLQQRIDDEAAARSEIGALVELSRRDLGQLAGQLAGLAGDDVVRRADLSAEDSQLRVVLGDGLQLLRTEIASVEQRSRDQFAEVATLLEALRQELTDAVQDVAHETLMALAEPLRDLTKAREEFESRLESLQRKVQVDQRRVEALDAAASAGASRLHALEQQVHTAVQRLFHRPGANPEANSRPSGALLDSLDRQLREAEERLGQL